MLGKHAIFTSVAVAFLLPTESLGDAGNDLAALQEEFFVWRQEQLPELATEAGYTKAYNDRLADLSFNFRKQFEAVQRFINRTRAIDRTQLCRRQQYSYDVFMDSLTTFTDNYNWRLYGSLTPVGFMEGFYLDFRPFVQATPFQDKVDFENYIKRLQARPLQVEQIIHRMRAAIERNTTNHNESMSRIPIEIEKVIRTPPAESELFKPFNTTLLSLTISQAEKDDLTARGLSALQRIWTSLQGLKTFIEQEYMPHTRATFGVHGLPDGLNYYRACLKWHLSVDMSPDQVHNTGLREMDRITQLMHQVIARQNRNQTLAGYFTQLSADPSFNKSSADEVLNDYRSLIFNKIYPKLSQLFKDVPPNPLVIEPLPFDGSGAMYKAGSDDGSRPGTFYVNVKRPTSVKTFSMMSLALHEAVPGHHLQLIYQAVASLPKFQKHFSYDYFAVPFSMPFYTAYTEGWGLYAEYLGEELGLYENDYQLMGRYDHEIFRACRLVVDTGLHFYGWSRQKAIDYIVDRTASDQESAELEVDRYLMWPGQACGYKIGELKIKELRQRARTALGSNFDVREFHSLILNNGPGPLSVLETIVNDYITEKGGSTAAPLAG